jgi:hypothetical protein
MMGSIAEMLMGAGVHNRFSRENLFQGEADFFRENPHVAGMATEDKRVIINPQAHPDVDTDMVKLNEAARLFMRHGEHRPGFEITPEQGAALSGYSENPQDIRDTLAARLMTGDPSGGRATPDQTAYVSALANSLKNWQSGSGGEPREDDFQKGIRGTEWFSEFVKQYGEEPDLRPMSDDPAKGPNYDYRKAWAEGVRPVRDPHDNGRFHWSSAAPSGKMLKSANHPTAWKEHFMREYGVNPDALPSDLAAALRGGKY